MLTAALFISRIWNLHRALIQKRTDFYQEHGQHPSKDVLQQKKVRAFTNQHYCMHQYSHQQKKALIELQEFLTYFDMNLKYLISSSYQTGLLNVNNNYKDLYYEAEFLSKNAD